MAAIAIGTSSWSFPAWRGVFYPETLQSRQFLTYYSRHFRTVEANTSFYAVPRPSTLVNWVDTVPPGFTFCLKFPRQISHERRLVDCEELSLAFLEVLRSLGDAAAPAFLQLPPDFSRERGGRALADYLAWLAPQLDGLRVAVEVRSRDLMTAAFAEFLAGHGFGMVLVDRVNTLDMYGAWLELIRGARPPRFVVVRWIGDDRNGPKGDRELSAPRDNDLDRWAGRIADLHAAGVDFFGYMHNPYEGHAPESVRRLEGRLGTLVDLPIWSPAPASDQPDGQISLFDA